MSKDQDNTYFPREPEGSWAAGVKSASQDEILWALGDSLDWLKTKCRDHQLRALAITSLNESEDDPFNGRRWLLALEMGSGKTKIAIDTYTIRKKRGDFKGQCLVLAKPIGKTHLKNEVEKHSDWSAAVVDGKPGSKVHTFLHSRADFVIVSVNWLVRFLGKADQEEEIEKVVVDSLKRFDMLVIDEAHAVASASSKGFDRLAGYLENIKHLYLLTGTPIGNSYKNLWGLYYFIDKEVYGDDYFAFLDRWFSIFTVKSRPGSARRFSFDVYSLVKDESQKQEFFDRFWTKAVRWEESELNDLPPKSYIKIPVQMTKDQERLYDRLLGAGPDGDADAETSQYELMKVTAGCYEGLKSSGKLDALIEIVREKCIEQKDCLIIWHWLQAEGEFLYKHLSKLLGAGKVGEVRGKVGERKRNQVLENWKRRKIQAIIANQGSLGTSVDLFETNLAVYWSNSPGIIDRKQSEKRISRDGQTRPVLYYDLVCIGSVDEHRLELLEKREKEFNRLTKDGTWRKLKEMRSTKK